MSKSKDGSNERARLEKEIGDLRAEVDRLREEKGALLEQYPAVPDAIPDIADPSTFATQAPGSPRFETRVGVEWLTRTAAFLLLSAATIGAVQTLSSSDLTPLNKLGILYIVSFVAMMYGVIGRRADGLLAKVALGGGIAGAYFSTYALFFVDAVSVAPTTRWALPSLLACLAFMGWILAWRRSQTAAGIALFLVYYTMISSAAEATDVQQLYYAFAAGGICCCMALWFMAAYRWYLVSWLSFFAIYGTHIYFFWPRISGELVQNSVLFWSSIGFLSLCYTVLAAGGAVEARTGVSSGKNVVALAIANTLTYTALTIQALSAIEYDRLWIVPLGLTVFLLILTLFAETSGPTMNLLYQTYLAMAVVSAGAAAAIYFDGGAVWIGFAALGLALAALHNITGIVVIKLLNIVLLAITAVGAMGAHRFTEMYTLPNDWGVISEGWVCLIAVTTLFALTAWYYHSVAESRPAQDRRHSGHWFLADTSYNLPTASVAMLHGVGAASVLCFGIIMLTDDRSFLPIMLTMSSVVLAGIGAFTNVPQVSAAAIGPLIAGQVTWYFNALWTADEAGDIRIPLAIASFIAVYGLAACLLWEHYLKQDRRGPVWEQAIVAGFPFALSGIFAVIVITHFMTPDASPYVAAGAATAASLIAIALHPSMFRIVGPSMIVMSAALQLVSYRNPIPLNGDPMSAIYPAIAIALAAILSERILSTRKFPGTVDLSRLIMLGTAGVIGLAVLERYAPPELRTAGWIGMAVAALLAGVLLPEANYRLLALGLIAATSVRAFTGTGPWQARTFALLGTIVLGISWIYSHELARRNERRKR